MRAFLYLGMATLTTLGLNGCGKTPAKVTTEQSAAVSKPDNASEPYLARRAKFQTALMEAEPAPQPWTDEPPPEGVQKVEYESAGRKLKAWLYRPEAPADKKLPALVYLHGGFAFGASDFDDCWPFVDAGFMVMCPTFRGENGNPGAFEMMYGEVDDAAAAVRWVAQQSGVDRDHIYVFGHSSGGLMSTVLSLYDDLPARHTGSAGGLYGTELYDWFGMTVPFVKTDRQEKQMRTLIGNIRWMKRPHYAFTGTEDKPMQNLVAREEAAKANSPLSIIELPGDHHTSLGPAMEGYLNLIVQDIQNK